MSTQTATKNATKTATKSATKTSDAKAASATEKARKTAIATIEKRIAAKPETKSKRARAAKPAKENAKRPSALDAAATVLAASKEPLRTKDLVEQMAAKGLWSSPSGKTPEATLHAALMREINTKGGASRFKKADRGLFASTGKAA